MSGYEGAVDTIENIRLCRYVLTIEVENDDILSY